MKRGILTAEDRARRREERRVRTEQAPRIPKAVREDEPPAIWPAWALKMRHELTAENYRLRRELEELKMSIIESERAKAHTNNAITVYGKPEEVKDLTNRLTYMLPNAEEIGPKGVALVAQIAIAHGLDPLPGSDHVYAWKQGGKLMVTIGYKGLLHLARQQVLFTHHSRPMNDAEREEYGVKDDQVAYVTELYEIAKAAQCQQAGIPYFPIIGTAVWAEKTEHRKKDGSTWTEYNDAPAGKTGAWVCRKNSLKDALRQIVRTGVRFGAALDAALQREFEWSIPLDDSAAPDSASAESLIAAGVIKPDQDDEEDTPGVIDQPPVFVAPPEGVCPACGKEPVDPDSPFGLCRACSRSEADKALAAEQQALFAAPRVAESDKPRKK